MVASTVNAQLTCDAPNVIVDDNLDGYAEGALGPQAAHWTTWSGNEGGAEDGEVTSENANSAPNSLKIVGESGGGPQDVLLLLGDKTQGMYVLEWQMYVPEGVAAYYNIQHSETPGDEWANEIMFESDGSAALNAGIQDARVFSYPQEEWFKVRYLIDLDNDLAYLWVAGRFIYSWPFSWQTTSMGGTKRLGSVDYFPIDDNHWFYVDDIYYAEVPAAEAGKYCHSATTIDVGTHTIGTIDCFGAGFTVRSGGQGQAGAWYAYTPSEDGVISLTSCGNGGDSRVWIFSGGCENLNVEGVNDDLCGINMDGEDEWASYREAMVTAGETYFIVWDNIWEDGNFDFTLDFTTDVPADGDFCETAIAITPGTYTIDQINGHATVAGPNINHTGASTTAYDQSEWYAFTPDEDGMMTVSSCALTDEDTRLWIYTGDCGIENIQLFANDDDGCGLQSLLMDMEVDAGTTYYIEWDSETLDAPGFDWELIFDPATAVTEEEFLSAFTLTPNPASNAAFVNYRFSESTDLTIRLINNIGQLISTRKISSTLSGSERFDLSGIASGIYSVVMTDGENVTTQRLVVE